MYKIGKTKIYSEDEIKEAIKNSYEHYQFNELMFWSYMEKLKQIEL